MRKKLGIFAVEKVRKKLKHYTAEKKATYWLDTGSPELNSALGSREYGLPYGKMYEIHGKESCGKTAMLLELAGKAQRDGAAVAWLDAEGSWDDVWAEIRGIDITKIAVFRPYVGTFGNERAPRISTAEDLFQELKTWVKQASRKYKKIFVGVDSIPALLPAAADVEEDDTSMFTKLSLASYLSGLMQRLIGDVIHYNIMLFYINQLRTKPTRFGSGEYTSGGNAVKFYCSVRAKMKRATKGGVILGRKTNKQIGIMGFLTNIKNKAGKGSVENIQIQYKILFRKPSKFMEV